MDPSSTTPVTPVTPVPVDQDLAEQAHPGHGIPSQDPTSSAQFALPPDEAKREAKSALMGGGILAGAATGATVGVVVAGPVGVVVGGAVGAVVGAFGAAAAGSLVTPETAISADTSPDDRARFQTELDAGGGRPTAQVDKVIAASSAQIWAALTTPAALKQFFFGADVLTDWQVGSPIRMSGEFKGEAFEDRGTIITFEPLRQLSFSRWSALSGRPDTPANHHLVSFDLLPEGGQTKVTLSQTKLTGGVTAADVEQRSDDEKNWASVLDGLEKLVLR